MSFIGNNIFGDFMRKFFKWLFIMFFVFIVPYLIFYFLSNNKNTSNYIADKTSYEKSNIINKIDIEENKVNKNSNIVKNNSTSNINNNELSSFTTKIYTKEPERQNNVRLTCEKLNNIIIKNGDTFSFCNTLGPATPEQGYQKAEIFDNDGTKLKEYGGGKCQISTTLYNAVLNVPNLEIIERHEHSNKVPYVANGKDAAVAYGHYDFKFKNNTGFDIKMNIFCTGNDITVKLLRI